MKAPVRKTNLDIPFQIYLSTLIRIQRVLISKEPTRIQSNPSPVLADRNRLRAHTEGVLDVHVIHLEIVFVDAQSAAGIVRASRASWHPSLNGDLVVYIR